MNNRAKMALVLGVATVAAAGAIGARIYFSPHQSCVRMLASRGIDRPHAEDACEKTRPNANTE
ncbi:MAG TPA: hypothetical protein VGH86_10240 [Phenylobacterium sp.]